ncbi:hypothetical protein Pla108_20720 [Botrimarina colliarenosi]|uniref:Uncharacterized protein n=1 Tax=Botrimarina colliarenosi TaxID=2528001 RepID=A0A5C6AF23_9BACT|nr:hypothetical protein [Botrimarina colliarenosi]TWT97918.1 hypothetical protein Pla108_20720 [Botrimarina colliarenosi]
MTSPVPLPAYGQNPRFSTAPVHNDEITPSRAIGKPAPGFDWLVCGYSAWLAAVSDMVTVEPSNIRTRRPFQSHSFLTWASSERPVSRTASAKNASGNRLRAWQ